MEPLQTAHLSSLRLAFARHKAVVDWNLILPLVDHTSADRCDEPLAKSFSDKVIRAPEASPIQLAVATFMASLQCSGRIGLELRPFFAQTDPAADLIGRGKTPQMESADA